jgi:hypothetical protein
MESMEELRLVLLVLWYKLGTKRTINSYQNFIKPLYSPRG